MIPPEYELTLRIIVRRLLMLVGGLLLLAVLTMWFLPYAAVGCIFLALAVLQMFVEQLRLVTGLRLFGSGILPVTTILSLLLGLLGLALQFIIFATQLFIHFTS